MDQDVPLRCLGRTARFVQVIKVLEEDRKITKRRLHEILGTTSESTWKRVKHELGAAGLPIKWNRADKHFHIPANAALARYKLDQQTRIQLATVRAAVDALGLPFDDALSEVLSVLDARIAYGDRAVEPSVTARQPQPRADDGFLERFDLVETALRERRWLRFTYRKTAGGELEQRVLAVYAVHTHEGRFYAWGIQEGETAPKMFVLDGMSEVSLEDDTFEPDMRWSLASALQYSFGIMAGEGPPERVVVEFDPDVAAFVMSRKWPAEVRSERTTSGVRLTFEVTKLDEIVAWVLSFGGKATISEPEAARKQLRTAAAAIIQKL